MGTLWQYQERQQSYTTHDYTRGHNGNRSIVTSKLKFRGKQHYTPARPTHTACSRTGSISWTSTTSLQLQMISLSSFACYTERARSWQRLRR